jgi:hypothetical protein
MVEKHSCPIAEPQGRQQNLPDPYTGRVLTNVSFGVAWVWGSALHNKLYKR